MNRLYRHLLILPLLLAVLQIMAGQASSRERIYVQTDRDIYIAGENIFFKCYNLDGQTKMPSTISDFAYMALRNDKNMLVCGICLPLENSMFSGCLYLPDTLSTGRYQLISFTNYMKNDGERSFFTKEILVANRFDKELSNISNSKDPGGIQLADSVHGYEVAQKGLVALSADKNVYRRRQKIKIKLEGIGIKDSEIANLSISVHENLPDANGDELATCFPKVAGQSENLPCSYLPEHNGLILQGQVSGLKNSEDLTKTLVFLSTPDSVSNLQYAYTDQSGNFKFQLGGYYFNRTLILNTPHHSKVSLGIDDKFRFKEAFRPSRSFPEASLRDFILKSQNIVQIQRIYMKDTVCTEIPFVSKSYQYPSLVYPPVSDAVYPADFVNLPDFEEISREILPFLKIRKHKDSYEARMLNIASSSSFESDPQVFLDGVPIENVNQIMNLGSNKIHKIESLCDERFLGNLRFPGILSVFTKKMEINNIVRSTPALMGKYAVVCPSARFKQFDISENKRDPDFRQLLFWEPMVTMKGGETKQIEFQASDNKGVYIVTVEGFTSAGNFIHASMIFNIANNLN